MSLDVTCVPNLCALVGASVAESLCASAGGAAALARLSDSALRHLGLDESSGAAHLRAGHLAAAPVFVEFFADCLDGAGDAGAARKAAALLARRCCVAVRADVSGAAGSVGAAEMDRVRRGFERLRAAGRVAAQDTQALPVPRVAGAVAAERRGGRALYRRQQAQRDAPGAVERAVAHVRMGVSEAEQLEALALRSDVRAELAGRAAKAPERKRRRGDGDDEYDDLMHIRL